MLRKIVRTYKIFKRAKKQFLILDFSMCKGIRKTVRIESKKKKVKKYAKSNINKYAEEKKYFLREDDEVVEL